MKEAVGGFSLFTIVIAFVVIFTGYISLSINYSKAYNVRETNYRSFGTCGEDFVGYTRTGELANSGDRAAFCIRGIPANGNSELPNALYYQVKVFWQLDLPVFGSLFNFSINGETARVYAPNECTVLDIKYDWCS